MINYLKGVEFPRYAEVLIKRFPQKELNATLRHRWSNKRIFIKPNRKLATVQLYIISLVAYICIGPNVPRTVSFPAAENKGICFSMQLLFAEVALEPVFLNTNLLLKKKTLKMTKCKLEIWPCSGVACDDQDTRTPRLLLLGDFDLPEPENLSQRATNEGCKQTLMQKTHWCKMGSFEENNVSWVSCSFTPEETIFSNKGRENQAGLQYNFHS